MQYDLFEPNDWPSFWLIEWRGPDESYPALDELLDYLMRVLNACDCTAIKAATDMHRTGFARMPFTPRAMTTLRLSALGVGVIRPGHVAGRAPRPAARSGRG